MNAGIDYLLNNFIWMGWNVGLALIPFVLAKKLFGKNVKTTTWWLGGFLLFLLFLPNTAYIITDIVHFKKPLRLYPDPFIIGVVTIQFLFLEFAGYWLFVESYRMFEYFTVKRFRVDIGLLRIVMFFMVSVGVFIGRFLRFNSWDIVVSPHLVVAGMKPLLQFSTLFFLSVFTLLLLLLYSIHDLFFASSSKRD